MTEEQNRLKTEENPETLPLNAPATNTEESLSEGQQVTLEEQQSTISPQEEQTVSETQGSDLHQQILSLTGQLEDKQKQFEDLKNRHLGLAAEFDNFRKRTIKEKEDLQEKIKGRTLEELLPAIDNFERARTQLKPSTDGEMAIHKSYQGVYKILVDNLKRLGVSPMRPEGEPFNPNYHEAMMQEAHDEYPEGTVIEQLIRGYMLGDRVLRHAMVKVSTGKAVSEEIDDKPEPVVTTVEEASPQQNDNLMDA